ncbi:MAG TPA: hypothetical protein VG734_01125 [Lacunisphaera sp.]|nr:hypothetical protein [Lacunisphaera sp.]
MRTLPPDVLQFLSRFIVSVEQLEVLLLLHAEGGREWTAAEINQRLRSQEASIEKWLVVLTSLGLVARNGARSRLSPPSPELAQAIARVAEAYRERPTRVIEAIFVEHDESLHDFVRAFNLRKNP